MMRIRMVSICLVLLATACGGDDAVDDGFDPRNLAICDPADPTSCEDGLVCYDGTTFDYCSPACSVDTDCPDKYDCATDTEDVEAGECDEEGVCDALENSADCAP